MSTVQEDHSARGKGYQMEKQEPKFTRAATAHVLGVSSDRLKDWSRGKPWILRPSVSSLGRGSKTIYSTADLYIGCIALVLSWGGMSCKTIARILPEIAYHLEWFAPETRGILRFHSLETPNPGIEHAPIPVTRADNSESIKFYLLHGRTVCTHLDLKSVLDFVDERIKELPVMPHDC
jgi:hypothetical protein